MRPRNAMRAVLSPLAASGLAAAGEEETGRAFTDVTAESGVRAAVAAHYARVPECWLSGLDLIDLDGDGDLDFIVCSRGPQGKGRGVAVWGRQSFHSYYTAAATERHVGPGRRETVDVSVEFYSSGPRVERRGVPADSTVSVGEGQEGDDP